MIARRALPIAVLLVLPDVAAAPADATTAARELEQTVTRLNALDRWFTDAEAKRARWETEIKRQDEEIATLDRAVAKKAAELAATEVELEALAIRKTQLEARQRKQAKLIGDHVAAAHRLTGRDFFKQLLNQESPDTFDRMIRYHRYFSEARLDLVRQFRETLVRLDDTNAELESRRAAQARQRESLLERQEALGGERADRATLLAELARETETKAEEYARLERNRERLEQLLAELRRRATELDGSAFVAARGHLPMPVEGPIRHAFGQKRAEGRLTWHGLDIAADHGTPVTAVFRGRVIFSDWLRGFGLLTILDHGSDYMTLYGNVDALHKKVGDWVESGEVIASAGNSGGKRDPGVYFEVRHEGRAKDPIGWVTR